MAPTKTQGSVKKGDSSPTAMPASPALEWLWQYLRDVQRPHFLDCGRVAPSTINLLLRRRAKVYVADLLSSLQRGDPVFWERAGKQLVFRVDAVLRQLPRIPAGTLSVICAWHLPDLIPREALSELMEQFFNYLEPGGVWFAILREPYLPVGMDTQWRFENLTTLKMEGAGERKFPYPALSNREVERLAPTASVKTFLTRTGRREIILLKER